MSSHLALPTSAIAPGPLADFPLVQGRYRLRFARSADDVDRALLHIGETSDAVADGLRLIQQRFNNLLVAHGVTAVESEGEVFDPEIHEAMTMIDGDGEQSGTVYSEHRRGYFINGKLLRPARVAVLK